MVTRTRLLAWLLGVAALATLWQIGQAQPPGRPGTRPTRHPADPASQGPLSALLGGEDRYLTYLSTDKPIYRPGEAVYVRGVVLDGRTNRPAADSAPASVKVLGPKGDVVASGRAQREDGVLAFAWEIPAGQAGGQYTVRVEHPWTGDAPAERKFDVRAYRAPRLRSQIKFLRDGYGPGDDVAATLEVTRAEGGIPAGAQVTIIARVDGAETFRGQAEVDADGHCAARFKLPAEITRGEGSLAMVIEDGGVVETASKTIPILLQTVDLTLYPEGGQLVAGVPNRVYFEAFTPAKKPADLAGAVVDADGHEVAAFHSEHEGRGRFTFTPSEGGKYELVITEPTGIRTTYPLPDVGRRGVVLSSLHDVFDRTVRLQLVCPTAGRVSVTLSKREQELARQELELAAGQPAEVALAAGDASGVLVATAWDAAGRPLAERLVFCRSQHEIRVNIAADRPRYVPAGKATLTVTTTDETGQPTSAVVGLAVTDDSVLEMIERREQAPRLPVMVLLESDVQDLADAHVYLDPENAQAPTAVDLLLGTQGWRRLALVDVKKFLTAHGDAARRVLALRMVVPQSEAWGGAGFAGGSAQNRFFADRPNGALADQARRGGVIDVDAMNLDGRGEVAERLGIEEDKSAQVADEPVAAPVPALAAREKERLESAGERERGELREALLEADARSSLRRLIPCEGPASIGLDTKVADDFVAVRVFAHHARPDRQPGERRDFTETLFWHAGVKTDDAGQATVEFDLSDAVTSFRVSADAFNSGGALGSSTTTIESVEPFYVEPKLPLEVTSGDLVLAPVGLVNGTDEPLETLLVTSVTGNETGDLAARVALPAGDRVRHVVRLPIGASSGPAELTLAASAGSFSDTVTRTIQVKPLGFPVERGRGGLVNPNDAVECVFDVPPTLVAGSLEAKAVVYPTPLANMTEALARLIREPYGCFEQTSSTIYPLVMAQQYFLDHQGVDPTLIERSNRILEEGYQRLVGFECKSGGYEWFGSDPGHDALTAYGLLEFTDMVRVRHVDPDMLARTQKWFLAQRDGKGGFLRQTHTLHTWLPDPEVANAYNTWALLEAGVQGDFSIEVGWVRDAADQSDNTYVWALAAGVLAAAGDHQATARLLDKLAGRQQANGSLAGATVSVVGSGGDALEIETTALAVLAWLHDNKYAEQVESAIQFLAESCKAGRFGSTQSTVLALKAITAYDRSRARPKAPGALELVVDGEPVGEPVRFTTDTSGPIELPDFAEWLTPGTHKVQIRMQGGSQMPFSVAVNFHAEKPDSSDDCRLELAASLADTTVTEGELTEVRLTVGNRTDEKVPTPIAIIGIPGGLEVRHDQLKELVKAGKIATYELLGRDLVLYWRALEASQRIELPISVVAAIPGRYTGPASRAYLYYTDEDKTWIDPLQVDITPRQ